MSIMDAHTISSYDDGDDSEDSWEMLESPIVSRNVSSEYTKVKRVTAFI